MDILDDNQDLSYLNQEVEDGLNSPLLEQSYEEIFKELKEKYTDIDDARDLINLQIGSMATTWNNNKDKAWDNIL